MLHYIKKIFPGITSISRINANWQRLVMYGLKTVMYSKPWVGKKYFNLFRRAHWQFGLFPHSWNIHEKRFYYALHLVIKCTVSRPWRWKAMCDNKICQCALAYFLVQKLFEMLPNIVALFKITLDLLMDYNNKNLHDLYLFSSFLKVLLSTKGILPLYDIHILKINANCQRVVIYALK